MRDAVLITVGARYIGTHVAVELARKGSRPVLPDSFANSERGVVGRLRSIVGDSFAFTWAGVRTAAMR
jgi:UDP-glucose 4-epimerase